MEMIKIRKFVRKYKYKIKISVRNKNQLSLVGSILIITDDAVSIKRNVFKKKYSLVYWLSYFYSKN